MGFPANWTHAAGTEDQRCEKLGRSYVVGIVARLIRHISLAPPAKRQFIGSKHAGQSPGTSGRTGRLHEVRHLHLISATPRRILEAAVTTEQCLETGSTA